VQINLNADERTEQADVLQADTSRGPCQSVGRRKPAAPPSGFGTSARWLRCATSVPSPDGSATCPLLPPA